jgi:putative acetyltransferase
VVRDGERAVGCGAIRRLAGGDAELKRMFVVPERRGQGVGRLLVAELEHVARLLGATRLVLETGVRQPDAIALYRKCGFGPIPFFGEEVGSELSVCMGKDLSGAG